MMPARCSRCPAHAAAAKVNASGTASLPAVRDPGHGQLNGGHVRAVRVRVEWAGRYPFVTCITTAAGCGELFSSSGENVELFSSNGENVGVRRRRTDPTVGPRADRPDTLPARCGQEVELECELTAGADAALSRETGMQVR
jgi:hypothetical protein